MARKKRRHMWTDEEKAQLIREVEEQQDDARTYLKSRGFTDGGSWFYQMRAKFRKEHPDMLQAAPEVVPTVALVRSGRGAAPGVFGSLDEATQRQKLAEYATLGHFEKKAWREANGATLKVIYYYRDKLSPTPLPPQSQPFTTADLRVYESLPFGQKQSWLKEHGFSRTAPFDLQKRSNGHSPAPYIPQKPHTPPTQLLAPTGHATSLDEAILAMEVERDQMSSFIEKLKRMRGPQ